MVMQDSSNHADFSSNEGSTENRSASNSTNQKRKGRGLAKKIPSWGNTQLVIEFDRNGNPCGGEYKKLATQLGFLAKDGISFPLTTQRWDHMDETILDNIWTDIQDWKCRVKERGYYAYDTDEERLANCPLGVVENQWPLLVSLWGNEEIQKRAKTNKANRAMQECLPHTGKKPMSVLIKERSDKGLPIDRLNLFIASRKGAKDATTLSMIDELQKESAELKEMNQDTPEELEKLFVDHFGEDGRGRMRCAPRGVTKTMVYGRKSGSQTTSIETIAAIRTEFEEKFELQKQETEARIQAEREACKAEMELQLQAFKQEMISQLQSQFQSRTG